MHKGFLIIFVPAAIVGVFYIALFRELGYDVGLAPFLGTGVAFAGGLAGVWRYHQRKRGGRKD